MTAPILKSDARIYETMETYPPELGSLKVFLSGTESPKLFSKPVSWFTFCLLPLVQWNMNSIYINMCLGIQNTELHTPSTVKRRCLLSFGGIGSSVSWDRESLRLPIVTRRLKFFKKDQGDGQKLPPGEPR